MRQPPGTGAAQDQAALRLEVWLYILPFAAAMLALEEGRKLLL